jgi:hypothetical protein
MDAFFKSEGFDTIGFEESVWKRAGGVQLNHLQWFKKDTLSVSSKLLECGIASLEILRWLLTVDYLRRIPLML